MDELWQVFGDESYDKALAAARRMAARGDSAIAFIERRLSPPGASPDEIARLVANLGSQQFETRQDATGKLTMIGSAAEGALRQAAKTGPNAEVRRRAADILGVSNDPARMTVQQRQLAWAVRVLEAVDSEASRKHLSRLADAPQRTWLAGRAGDALARTEATERLVADPNGASLEFRSFPNVEKIGAIGPRLNVEDFAKYAEALSRQGPPPPSNDASYVWRPAGCELPATPFAAALQGRTYVLLSNQSPHTALVRRPQSHDMIWDVISARCVRGSDGAASLHVTLGGEAARSVASVTSSNVGNTMAVLVGGHVIATFVVTGQIGADVTVAGLHSQRQVSALAGAIKAAMPPKYSVYTAFQGQDKQLAGRLLRDFPSLVNGGLPYGSRALDLAMYRRWFDLAEELIKAGANVNAADSKSGRTVLHAVADGGNVEAIRLLVKHGADLTAVDNKGLTPLHHAVIEDPNSPAVAALVEAGADVNATGKVGITPLTLAIIQNGFISRDDELAENAACIKLLADHKARLDALSAAGLGRIGALKAMIARKEPLEIELAPFKMRISALHVAAMCGQAETARLLIQAGADLKSSMGEMGTPLHAAARAGHGQIVKLLLDAGADPNTATDREGLPIHAAAERGHAGVVAQLLDAGCDVSAPGHSGRTPLIAAASRGRLAVVKLLLARGADAAGKPNSDTPLRSVCNGVLSATEGRMEKGQDYPACAKLLLAAGADIEAPDCQGLRPLHWASHCPVTGRPSPQIVRVARVLIDAGADVNAAVVAPKTNGYRGRTPICFAADSCSAELIKALLDAGADPFVESGRRHEPMPVQVAAGMVNVGGKAAHELLQAATDKREQAEQRRVEAVTTEFFQAVADANDAAARALTVEGLEYWSHDKWPARIKRIRDQATQAPQMLGPILAAKVRPNWAEVRTGLPDQPPQLGQEPRPRCALFILMHMPDGSWRLAEFTEVSYGPQEKLGVYLQNIDMGGGFRDKVFGDTDTAKQKNPGNPGRKEKSDQKVS